MAWDHEENQNHKEMKEELKSSSVQMGTHVSEPCHCAFAPQTKGAELYAGVPASVGWLFAFLKPALQKAMHGGVFPVGSYKLFWQ